MSRKFPACACGLIAFSRQGNYLSDKLIEILNKIFNTVSLRKYYLITVYFQHEYSRGFSISLTRKANNVPLKLMISIGLERFGYESYERHKLEYNLSLF